MSPRKTASDNSIKLRNNPVRDIIVITVCALIVMSGIGWGVDYFRKRSENQVNDDAVTKRYITPVNIHIAGYVKSVNFEPNQVVKSGDTLLILENTELQIKIAEAEAALKETAIGADLRNLRMSAKAEVDQTLLRDNSDQILIARRIEVLDAYKENLSCTVIVAPCDGFVDRCVIKEGQLVQAGQLLTNIVSDY